MKDFAKSIVCNTKAEVVKVGNSYQYAGSIPIEKIPDNWRPEFPKAGYIVYYAPNKAKWFATEAEAKKFAESQDKAQKAGNSKCGNADVVKDGNKWVVLYAEGTKSKEFDSEAEAKKFAAQVGNSKVGNTDILSGNYIILSDDGHVWFRDEHEDVSLKNLDAWAQKRISGYQRSIDEIKKGVAEAKQAAKKYGLL